MKLHVLGSGSKGNCAIVETTTTAIMIDCGLTKKTLFDRSQKQKIDLNKISALLITHEHNDHIKGLGVCLRGLNSEFEMPIYCSNGTRAGSKYLSDYPNFKSCCSNSDFSIGNIHVDVFSTSHDAAEPIGFRFTEINDGDDIMSIGYITDTGIMLPEAQEKLYNCDILAIETNHDPKMLKNGPYPTFLKQRIFSDIGHLSNNQSAQVVEQIATDKLRSVIGMHMSQENNYIDLPENALKKALLRCGVDANVVIAGQNIPKSV